MSIVTSETSATSLMARFRGLVVDARPTYPERIRLEVIDENGGRWRLITWYAEYSPTEVDELEGKAIVHAELDRRSDILEVGFSDETSFTVTPVPDGEDDAIENWELFTPEGWVLTHGPWGRWRLSRADEPS